MLRHFQNLGYFCFFLILHILHTYTYVKQERYLGILLLLSLYPTTMMQQDISAVVLDEYYCLLLGNSITVPASVLMQAKQWSKAQKVACISMDLPAHFLGLLSDDRRGVAPLYGDGDENSKRTCTLTALQVKGAQLVDSPLYGELLTAMCFICSKFPVSFTLVPTVFCLQAGFAAAATFACSCIADFAVLSYCTMELGMAISSGHHNWPIWLPSPVKATKHAPPLHFTCTVDGPC